MRVFCICRRTAGEQRHLITAMHKLRNRIFKGRLDWDVSTYGDMEIDVYDMLNPTYLIGVTDTNLVASSVRILPTTGANMLANTFSFLLGDHPPPRSATTFECSRFCVDTENCSSVGTKGLNEATFSLLAAVLEWGLAHRQEAIAAVTDVRFERILNRAGWPLERFGAPTQIGNTRALAGRLAITSDALANVRRAGCLSDPVLVSNVELDRAA